MGDNIFKFVSIPHVSKMCIYKIKLNTKLKFKFEWKKHDGNKRKEINTLWTLVALL